MIETALFSSLSSSSYGLMPTTTLKLNQTVFFFHPFILLLVFTHYCRHHCCCRCCLLVLPLLFTPISCPLLLATVHPLSSPLHRHHHPPLLLPTALCSALHYTYRHRICPAQTISGRHHQRQHPTVIFALAVICMPASMFVYCLYACMYV